MNRTHRWTLVSALFLVATPAVAQITPSATDMAARHELLRRAQDASNAGRHAEALDLAQHAATISMTTSLRAFLGQEHRALGQLAEAMGDADTCVREVEHNPTLPQREAILSSCRALVNDLAPRLGHVTVRVDPPADGIHVRVASGELNPAFYGLPYLVTPGPVSVDASAPGREPFHHTVTVAAGGNVEVTVAMHPSAVASVHVERVDVLPSPQPHPTTTNGGGPPVGAIVVAGAGLLGLGASLVFYLVASGSESSFRGSACAQDSTGQYHCYETAHGQYNDAVTQMTIADVALGVGIAAVATGALWWALSPRHGSVERPRAIVWALPTAGGVMLGVGGEL